MNNKTTFSIYSDTKSKIVTMSAPLNVSYLIDEKVTLDNTNGEVHPNFSILHKDVYNIVSKIENLIGSNKELVNYDEWDRKKWYSAGSLVYFHDEKSDTYRFYRALKMTSPYISPVKEEGIENQYWNSFNSQRWVSGSNHGYNKDTIVYRIDGDRHTFFECIATTDGSTELSNTAFWKPLNLELWDPRAKYNIGSRVYLDQYVYTCKKTVLPFSDVKDTEYWVPHFDDYALLKITKEMEGIVNLTRENHENTLSYKVKEVLDSATALKEKFNFIVKLRGDNIVINWSAEDGSNANPEDIEIYQLFEEVSEKYIDLLDKWEILKDYYFGIYDLVEQKMMGGVRNNKPFESSDLLYGKLWKNMYDLSLYFKETYLYYSDPMKVLESLRRLDSFQDLLRDSDNRAIVAYVKNLYDKLDPNQKVGGYFIYDFNKNRFIKTLIGQDDLRNKIILDQIVSAYDDISDSDNISSKVLTIKKEKAETADYAWEYKAQWEDMDFIPDKPTDGKEYLLKAGVDGDLSWTDKFGADISFVKKEVRLLGATRGFDINVDMATEPDGSLRDSYLLFKDSLLQIEGKDYRAIGTTGYDKDAKVLRIDALGSSYFESGRVFTLLAIRDTSLEMLTKLSDEYVSKKEAIEILSNGKIHLEEYVKRNELNKYSLRNHIHTNYASRVHSHEGIYASYYHNHDGYYITRQDVNEILGTILSINPDLIEIIAGIAEDAQNLENMFVSKTTFNDLEVRFGGRLEALEDIKDNTLYFDSNTGLLSVKVDSEENGVPVTKYEPVTAESYQILTKYKITDDPNESVRLNLEEYLDYLTNRLNDWINNIEEKVKIILKKDKYIRTYVINTVDELKLSNFRITGMKLIIDNPFRREFQIRIGEAVLSLVDRDVLIKRGDIFHKENSVTDYIVNLLLNNTKKVISFDIPETPDPSENNPDPIEEDGDATLLITGYVV